MGAIALVAYLLWPTWGADGSSGPARLPVSIGGTLFNVPTAAIRMKIQRHSGRRNASISPSTFPRSEPPEAPKHVSADTVVEEAVQPIDRIFLSIAAHHDTLAPDMRVRTIYPRYLDQASTPGRGRTDDARVPRRHALRRRGSVFRRRAEPHRALHARRRRPPECA